VKNPEVIVKIFDLSRFCETGNSQVLKLASNIPLAWTQSFWTCCLIVTMLASCNPRYGRRRSAGLVAIYAEAMFLLLLFFSDKVLLSMLSTIES
jgi:hypothetical protein